MADRGPTTSTVSATRGELLDVAAVIGSPFDVELLAVVARTSVPDVLAALGDAAAAGVVHEVSPGGWSFADDDSVGRRRASLSPEVRAAWSRAIVDALGPRVSAEVRAPYALSAVGLMFRDDVVEVLREAGRDAMRRGDPSAAASWCERAVGLVPVDAGAELRCAVLVEAAEALRAAGRIDDARALVVQVMALDPRPAMRVRAALAFVDPGTEMGLACAEFDATTTLMLERALSVIGDDDLASAALVGVRLASQLYFSAEAWRAEPLALEAVARARRAGDERVMFAALVTHHDGYVVGRVPASDAVRASAELVSLARRTGDTVDLLSARRARVIDLLAAGDLSGVDAEIAAFDRLARESGSPAATWWPAMWAAMRAHLDGRLDDAERLAGDAFALGASAFPTLAAANYGFLLFACRWDQGRLGELEDAVRSFAREHAAIPAIEPSLALVLAELGHHDEAAELVGRLADDRRLADRNWPSSWLFLSRAAYLVGDAAAAGKLIERGGHLSGQCVQVSLGTVCLGAADLGLAWLHEAAGDIVAADAAYVRATATNRRLGARAALARTYADHARLCSGRDDVRAGSLASAAISLADRNGLTAAGAIARRALATPSAAAPIRGQAMFRREGPVWHLQFEATSVRLPPSKGFADLAVLLARPGDSVPALELLARDGGVVEERRGDPLFDEQARRSIADRLAQLDARIAEAAEVGLAVRLERLRAERDELVRASVAALGLGGRSRRSDDAAERARKAVTARVRNAIDRIRTVHPSLAAHLDRSVDTGAWCAYRPEHAPTWEL
jgi:tetratricopeptide (TPR) repeat protein